MIPSAANTGFDALPKLFSENGINDSFGDELEEWFSENFAFRNALVDIFARLKLGIFSEGNEQVIVGEDSFLFFADTLDSYLGRNTMTDDEIIAAAETLRSLSDSAKAAGAKFLFVCAPNKNTIYGDMMPDRYKRCELSELDRLYAELDRLNVEYTDLRHALSAASADKLVYHRRDTHWNGAGAYIAFCEITEALELQPIDLSERGPFTVYDFEGDLDALLFPDRVNYDENTTYDFDGLYIFTSAYATPMDITITTRGGGSGKLLCFRDSFANALLPYAAASFAEARFERAVPYNIGLAETFGADYVIVEIAERNLRDLIGMGVPAEN